MKSAEVDQSLQAHLAQVNNGLSVEQTCMFPCVPSCCLSRNIVCLLVSDFRIVFIKMTAGIKAVEFCNCWPCGQKWVFSTKR